MIVRPATIVDAPKIAQVHVETWRSAYRGLMFDAVLDAQSTAQRAAFWRERLTQGRGTVFVAEDPEVLGFCHLVPSRDQDADEAVAEIAAIYVLRAYWRQGAGRLLCERALAAAQQQGYRVVTLWVLAANEGAKRFYEAQGFGLDGATKTEEAVDGSELRELRLRRWLA